MYKGQGIALWQVLTATFSFSLVLMNASAQTALGGGNPDTVDTMGRMMASHLHDGDSTPAPSTSPVSARARDITYVIDGRTQRQVRPQRTDLAPLPSNQEYVETCIDSSHFAPNPNYKDPAKSASGIAGALFKGLASGLGAKVASGPGQAVAQAAGSAASDAQSKAQPTNTKDREIWVASQSCQYTTRVIPPPPAKVITPADNKSGYHVMTKAEVEKAYRDNPMIPRPIGGGLYQMQWYDGSTVTGTREALGEASNRHYALCFALHDDPRAYKAEHCDR